MIDLFYFVKSGDSLKTIAQEMLRDENKWREIGVNNNILPPYIVYLGQRLLIPVPESEFEPNAPVPTRYSIALEKAGK